MQKLTLLILLVCSMNASKAQTKCDSLHGKWVFTRWQADNMFLDIEDSAATIRHKFQQYKEASNGASLSKADSLDLVNGLREVLKDIRTNGFISFTFNKDKTFSWKGTVNDPNEQFSGTYSCDGNAITLVSRQNNGNAGGEQIVIPILSFNKNSITIVVPSSNNPHVKNSRMSFKRVK